MYVPTELTTTPVEVKNIARYINIFAPGPSYFSTDWVATGPVPGASVAGQDREERKVGSSGWSQGSP